MGQGALWTIEPGSLVPFSKGAFSGKERKGICCSCEYAQLFAPVITVYDGSTCHHSSLCNHCNQGNDTELILVVSEYPELYIS